MAKAEYSFDSYATEAEPIPFKLRVSQDEVIVIPYPTGDQMLRVDESRTAREILRSLCGDQWTRVFELVGDKHAKVMEKLADDIRHHFGLSGNPSGGGRA